MLEANMTFDVPSVSCSVLCCVCTGTGLNIPKQANTGRCVLPSKQLGCLLTNNVITKY